MDGGIYIEAKGLGIIRKTPFLPNENPLIAADNLVYKEDMHRKSLVNSWKSKRINNLN